MERVRAWVIKLASRNKNNEQLHLPPRVAHLRPLPAGPARWLRLDRLPHQLKDPAPVRAYMLDPSRCVAMDAAIPARHLCSRDPCLARALGQDMSDGDHVGGVTAALSDHALGDREQRGTYLGRGKDTALALRDSRIRKSCRGAEEGDANRQT